MVPTAPPSRSASATSSTVDLVGDAEEDRTPASSTARLTLGDYYPPSRPKRAHWSHLPPPPRVPAQLLPAAAEVTFDALPPAQPATAERRFRNVNDLRRLSHTSMARPAGADANANADLAGTENTEQNRSDVIAEAHTNRELPVSNEELAISLGEDNAGFFGNRSGDAQQRTPLVRWGLNVLNNNFEHPAARAGASLANIALRDFASVAVTTSARQIAGHYIGKNERLDSTALGVALGLMPFVLQNAALVLDHHRQRDTQISIVSRILLGTLSLGAFAATARAGKVAEVAPAMLTFGIYCAMRDLTQRFLQTKDQLPGMNVAATFLTSAAYLPNQMAVNSAMSAAATPSGVGTSTPEIANALRRGAFNWSGETLDDVVFGTIQAALQKTSFQVRLSPQVPSLDDLSNTFCRQFAARFTVFMSIAQVSTLFAVGTEDKVSKPAETHFANLLGATALAFFYNLALNSQNTKVRKSSSTDPEGHPGFDGDGARQDRL